ncbi:alpha/beta hydrolase [Candidatus Gracilibacteria bacterium]|nr:alpha/beta hydrolase [Candidatus Gracilibacteria bacterium]
MTHGVNGYVDVGDGKLYYEVAGDGEPLVLSHAGFVDSRMWDDQWDAFAQHYRVIRFDMRGCGKSDRAEAPIVRRDDLYHLLKHLGIERATLLGCSLSGEIILDIALEHPELVTALVVVSAVPSGFELQGEPPRYLMEMMAAIGQGDLTRASELQNRIWIDGPFRESDQVDPHIQARAAEMNRIALANGTLLNVDLSPLKPLNPPAVQRLTAVQASTLIIVGELDHPEVLRAADVMTATIPGSRKEIMPNCAHLLNMEQPATFNQIVLDFLHNRT